ncbi:MAG: hypothetical protein IPN55_04255 [Saprospiraceae bacterium]|nr:hypothetical protein [Candidatus Brachybacter algidus]
MNKIFIKYGFPLSLIFIMLCLAFNKDVAFLVQWNIQYGLNIDPKACYYISLIYLSIVTCITSYYFYLKMEEEPNEEQLHPVILLYHFYWVCLSSVLQLSDLLHTA